MDEDRKEEKPQGVVLEFLRGVVEDLQSGRAVVVAVTSQFDRIRVVHDDYDFVMCRAGDANRVWNEGKGRKILGPGQQPREYLEGLRREARADLARLDMLLGQEEDDHATS